MDPSGHLLPLGHSSAGQLGRCPRLAGIPPPEGPMTPPPYPPVTAVAPPVPVAAPPVTVAPSVMAVASTQATVPNPHGEEADDPKQSPNHEKGTPLLQVSKAPPGIRGCRRLLRPECRVASREPRTARSCSRKHRHSQSRRRDSRPTVPFPLQEHEGRLQAIRTLYEEAGEHRLASEMTALRGLRESHPEMGAEETAPSEQPGTPHDRRVPLDECQPRHSPYPACAPRRGSTADASSG